MCTNDITIKLYVIHSLDPYGLMALEVSLTTILA